jgi:hypothetical protein
MGDVMSRMDWNPADEFAGDEPKTLEEEAADAQDAADHAHEVLEEALAELEETGVALRRERDRLFTELWRWRFQWFWGVVDQVARLDQASDELTHAGILASHGYTTPDAMQRLLARIDNAGAWLTDEVA